MITSSLYWALEKQEISPEEACLKARDIVWTFKISPVREREIKFGLGPEFKKVLNAYHGKYPYYEPKGYDGEDSIKYVRERLKNKPISVPKQLQEWINQPLNLLNDFNIMSTIPWGELESDSIDRYVQLQN